MGEAGDPLGEAGDPFVLPASALADRTADPALAPLDVVPPVWLTLVPFEDTEPDVDADVDWLALVDVDAGGVTFGLEAGVLGGVGVEVGVGQGVAVALAVVLPPVALVFALAEAVETVEAVVVAALVGVTVVLGVAVAVLVGVPVAVVLSLGLVLAGLALVLLVAGLGAVAAGGTLGDTDLVLFEEDDEEHTVAFALAPPLEMLLELTLPADADCGLPCPAAPWVPLLWEEVIPTAELSWPKAWRSGGNARTTPMANTAQAAARAGRSSPSRQSRG